MNAEQINREKELKGQPTAPTEEEIRENKIASKVIDKMSQHICRRCTCLLKTEEEIKNGYCEYCWKIVKEQREHERVERETILNNRIKNVKREIGFKNSQIENKDIKETQVVVRQDDGRPVVYEGFIDNLKPEFMIYNELEGLKAQVKMYERQIDQMNKSREKDDRAADNKE